MVNHSILSGIIVDEHAELTLIELCHACGRPREWFVELIDEGIIEPIGPIEKEQVHWRFYGTSLRRALIVRRLESDLGVNLPGAALALELLDEVEALRARVR